MVRTPPLSWPCPCCSRSVDVPCPWPFRARHHAMPVAVLFPLPCPARGRAHVAACACPCFLWPCQHQRRLPDSTLDLSTNLSLRRRRVSGAVSFMNTDVAVGAQDQGRAQMGRTTRSRARHAEVDGDPGAEVNPSKP